MKYLNLAALLIMLFIIASCNDQRTPEPNASVPQNNVLPPASQQPASPNTSVSNTTTSGASTAKLNPAHGQPGHRCDLNVGDPLPDANSNNPAVKVEYPTSTTTTTVPVQTTNSVPNATVAPGLNPQHGQPGHRCDIAVGAPLNSKPAQ